VNPLSSSLDLENNKFHKRMTLRNYLESIKEEESRSREEDSNIHSVIYKKKGIELDGSSLDLSKVQWPEIIKEDTKGDLKAIGSVKPVN
jgi:hypothetical protein